MSNFPNFHESTNTLHWEQPKSIEYNLQLRLTELLQQYWLPEDKIKRIQWLTQETSVLAKATWEKLASLKLETIVAKRLGEYSDRVAKLDNTVSSRILEIMNWIHNPDNYNENMAA